MRPILICFLVTILILSCEGDYDVSYEWQGMAAFNADNSGYRPVKSDADSLPAAIYSIKLEMDEVELSKSGRYPDTETPPINVNRLDTLIITSNYYFDATHPSGSNLTDLFIILNDNYLRTIPADGSEGYDISKLYADDFNEQYIVDEIDLLLMQQPEMPGFQKFHISFTLSDGTTFLDSTQTVYLQ